jgi:signal transduction histidine kinase
MKNISFNVIYDKNTPKSVFVDKVRLTQVVSAVLQKTITLLDSENSFEIQVKQIVRNKTKQLSISIVDDGIGIGFKDYISNATQIGRKEETSINGIDISVETIEDLIKLHHGEIQQLR